VVGRVGIPYPPIDGRVVRNQLLQQPRVHERLLSLAGFTAADSAAEPSADMLADDRYAITTLTSYLLGSVGILLVPI
jgi:hypothetical protein